MIHLKIDGKNLEVNDGTTVLQAAREAGIRIPTLCDHPDLTPYGGCRLCMVEAKGIRGLQAACTLLATDGMDILTDTPIVNQARRDILTLLLSTYFDPDYEADHSKNELLSWARTYGIDPTAYMAKAPRYPIDSDPNPFVRVDLNKCIVCTRCVRACADVQGRFVWSMSERGYSNHPVAGADTTMLEARCESCGACVAFCPTGALDNKMSYQYGEPDKIVPTTCTFCGVGCLINLNVKDGKVIRVTSTSDAPVNGMSLCVKGRYGYDFIHHPDRLTKPKVRRYLLEGKTKPEPGNRSSNWDWIETDWETALSITAEKLRRVRDTDGPDSVGILSSAKCLNEENYLMNKFARQVIGTNSVDHCARLCHSSTVTGLAAAYGSGAMTNPMDDIAENASSIFIIGSNTTEQHPVFGAKIRQAVLKRHVKLVVADPRRIEITEFAVLHLRQRPGTDVPLINGLMHIILDKGWEDKEFIAGRTEGFDEFKTVIDQYPPEVAAEITGVPVEELYQAAEILSTHKPMAVIWAMGITQHIVGVRNVMDLANLQMLLGNLGISGGGINPLRGQNNVQGACDMGALPNYFPAYQQVTNEQTRQKFESAWGVPLSPSNGLTVTEMIPDILEGNIKALYILAEDPVMTDPDTNHIRHCLQSADFIALQEIFPSETSVYADVLLPGTSFAEKTGTFTNTERRVQMVHKAVEPPGEAHEDWRITTELANRILASSKPILQDAPYGRWDYHNTSEIMAEVNALAPSYAGVTYERLERGERLHWPVKSLEHPGTPILHVGQFTRGKGKFTPIDHIPPAELPDENFPMILSTGRVLYHWHGGEMTRRAKGLMEIYGHPRIEVNPEDAEQLGIKANGKSQRVRITSRRGRIDAEAWITDRVPPGMVFSNFHFPEASANELTKASLDPVAKIPEYKISAVRVEILK